VRRILAIATVTVAVTASCDVAVSPEPDTSSVVVQVSPTTTSATVAFLLPQAPVTTRPSAVDPRPEEHPPVEMADPVRLISLDMDVEAVISTESRTQGLIDPIHGQIIWVPVGDRDAGPGEQGLVLMAAHLNKGEPFYNLIDDSAKDQRNGADDRGLPVGASVDIELADGTVCSYVVIEPLGVDIEGVQTVPGQPAIYFPKQGAVMNSILAQLIADVDQRPIVMMWVSYAGPNNDEWRSNGVNRANNAVVFADLDLCQTPVR
jgi:hypothetical protein